MPQVDYYTAEMVRALPDDGNRYETVHGELLVTPAPRGFHQLVLTALIGELLAYLRDGEVRDLLVSPADISFSSDVLVQPDLFVADLAAFRRTGEWSAIQRFHLVVEVLSPSSRRADRFTKRRLYQEHRIPEYWAVDIDRKLVEVWTPEATLPRVERDRLTWRHPAIGSDCVIELAKLFTRA